MSARAALLALAVVLAAGCGGGDDPAPPTAPVKQRSERLVDFSKKPPFVNTLDIDETNGDFLLTTNRGFWRIAKDGSTVTPVKGTLTAAARRRRSARSWRSAAAAPASCWAAAIPTSWGRCRTSSACCARPTAARPGVRSPGSATPTCTRSS